MILSVKVEIPSKLSKNDEDQLREIAEHRGEKVADPGDRTVLGKIRSAFQ
jgi:DnaJ-class molecular chaperone